ncbi:MAG: hypothetical protein F4053_00585 [Proteobacteria bacterium]|nr:hypothetical protein [Pseudomonadota bacterium]
MVSDDQEGLRKAIGRVLSDDDEDCLQVLRWLHDRRNIEVARVDLVASLSRFECEQSSRRSRN